MIGHLLLNAYFIQIILMREIIHSTCDPHVLELAVYDHCIYLHPVHISTEYEPNGRL